MPVDNQNCKAKTGVGSGGLKMENFLNLTNVVILLKYQSNFKEYGLHIISMLLFCACNLYDESIRRIHSLV